MSVNHYNVDSAPTHSFDSKYHPHFSFPRIKAKWVVPFIFLPGVLCSLFNLPGSGQTLTIVSIISFVLSCILISQLSMNIEKELWVWVIFFIFIMGYYVKYFFFAASLIHGDTAIYNFELPWLNKEILDESLLWFGIGFWVYCVTASILLFLQQKKITRVKAFSKLNISTVKSKVFLFVFYVCSLFLSFITINYGFGQMGIEHQKMPLRLDAFITHFNMTLVPLVTILLLWLTDNKTHRKYWWFFMITFMFLTLVSAIIRTSRSALLVSSIPLFFLWTLTNRFTVKRKLFIIVTIIVTFILYPFFSFLRDLRIDNNIFNLIDLKNAFVSMNDLQQTSVIMIQSITTRIGGLDGLLHNLSFGTPTFIDFNKLMWLVDNEKVSNYQTYEVVGISYAVVEGRSPGLLGAFAMVGGLPGIIILMPLFTVLVWSFWTVILKLKISPVAMAFCGSTLLFYTSEGVLGIQAPVAWFAGIAITSLIYPKLRSTIPRRSC